MTTPGLKGSRQGLHGRKELCPLLYSRRYRYNIDSWRVTGSQHVSSGHPLPLAEDRGEDAATQDEGMIWNT